MSQSNNYGQRVVAIAEIQQVVAEHFDIPEAKMRSRQRMRMYARPRQVAMYLARVMTDRTYQEIGRRFGGKHYSTAMHASKHIRCLLSDDRDIAAAVDAILDRLGVPKL